MRLKENAEGVGVAPPRRRLRRGPPVGVLREERVGSADIFQKRLQNVGVAPLGRRVKRVPPVAAPAPDRPRIGSTAARPLNIRRSTAGAVCKILYPMSKSDYEKVNDRDPRRGAELSRAHDFSEPNPPPENGRWKSLTCWHHFGPNGETWNSKWSQNGQEID